MARDITEIALRRRLPGGPSAGGAEDFFYRLGFEARDITQTEQKTFLKVSVFTSIKKRVLAAEKAFSKQPLKSWSLMTRPLGEDDWLHKWKRHFRITPLGKKFAVVPLWHRGSYRGKRRVILLDPQSAFGSGTHETTRLMAELMETLEGRFKTFFDAGCGTGVLSAAAAFLGARTIAGADLDPGSVKTARLNLRLNKIRGRMTRSDLTRQALPGRFDVVAANLISKTLTECQAILGQGTAPGGHLLVSGISLKNFPGFLRDFKPRGLILKKKHRGKSWAAALYQKPGGSGAEPKIQARSEGAS